jgi:hypothetical protein
MKMFEQVSSAAVVATVFRFTLLPFLLYFELPEQAAEEGAQRT